MNSAGVDYERWEFFAAQWSDVSGSQQALLRAPDSHFSELEATKTIRHLRFFISK